MANVLISTTVSTFQTSLISDFLPLLNFLFPTAQDGEYHAVFSHRALWAERLAPFNGGIISLEAIMAVDERKYPDTVVCADTVLYENIIEQVRDMILIADINGRILDANNVSADAHGYSMEEILQMNVQDLRPPEHRSFTAAHLKTALENGVLFRTVHMRRSGERFPVEVNAKKFKLLSGDAIIGVVRDISDTVKLETALTARMEKYRKLYEELVKTRENLTASEEELKQQYDELQIRENAIRKQNAILTMLHETAWGFMHKFPPEELLQKIVAGATEIIGTPHGFIYKLNKQKGVFCRSHGLGMFKNDIGREIPIDQGIVGAVYKYGQPVISNRYNERLRLYAKIPFVKDIYSIVEIPLKSEGQVIGTIGLAQSEEGKDFSEEEVEILKRFSELASIALDNAFWIAAFEKELADRRQAQAALQISEAKYRAVFASSSEGICILDLTHRIVDLNDTACEIFSCEREELLWQNVNTLGIDIPYDEQEGHTALPELFECQLQRRVGSTIWIEVSLKHMMIGQDKVIMAVVRDISERKAQAWSIWQLAYYDQRTGLPNRVFLHEQLEKELEQARLGKIAGALFHIDMDDLKVTNNTAGRIFGDEVIAKAGQKLVAGVGEQGIVARVAGDEFIVLLPHESDRTKIIESADRLIKLLNHDFETSAGKVHMSGSLGIACYPADGDDVDTLLKNADLALHMAKTGGKNTWRFYESEASIACENMVLKQALRDAIKRKELSLLYQPIISASSGNAVKFEALLRWNSAEHGSVPPNRFIPLAEETDIIHDIGNWVINEACQFARRLTELGRSDVCISVNVSPRQLVADDFVDRVYAAIENANIQTSQMEIEITETAVMSSIQDTIEKLIRLRDIGVRISLDDFGTGYSSLTYLRRLPLQTLKIDKSFIDQMSTDSPQMQLVSSIIAMAHILQLTVVAEGVETKQQLRQLLDCQCDFIQGYYFSRPIIESEAILCLNIHKS